MKNKIIILLALIAANLQCAEQSQFAQVDSDAEMSQAVQAAPTDDLADALLGDEEIKKKAQAENSTKKQLTSNVFLLDRMPDSIADNILAFVISKNDDFKILSQVSKFWLNKFGGIANALLFMNKFKTLNMDAALDIAVANNQIQFIDGYKNRELERIKMLVEDDSEEAKGNQENFEIQELTMASKILSAAAKYNRHDIAKNILLQFEKLRNHQCMSESILKALKRNYGQMVEFLLDADENIKFTFDFDHNVGKNLFCLAVEHNKLEIFKILLSYAEFHNLNIEELLNPDDSGEIMEYAIKNNNMELIKLLVMTDVNLTYIPHWPGKPNALTWAIRLNKPEICSYLVQMQRDNWNAPEDGHVNFNINDTLGLSFIAYAIELGHMDIAYILLGYVSKIDPDCMMVAIRKNQFTCAKVIFIRMEDSDLQRFSTEIINSALTLTLEQIKFIINELKINVASDLLKLFSNINLLPDNPSFEAHQAKIKFLESCKS